MPTTFDLSDASHGGPNLPQSQPTKGSGKGRGTGLPIDDYARTLLYLSLAVTGLCLVYSLWGLFSGAWTNPAWAGLSHQDRLRHLGNIHLIGTILSVASVVDVLCLTVCCWRDEGVGYLLFGIAAMLYAGMPPITQAVLDARGFKASNASGMALQMLAGLAWIYLVPSIGFVLVDFVRRLRAMSERAAIQRANMRYGADAQKVRTGKQRNVFLGRCWELPYCRDQVRVKCPIYIRRKGPCWWYKEGCMCEERIVLQAVIDTDWRDKTQGASQKLGLGQTGSESMAAATPKPAPPGAHKPMIPGAAGSMYPGSTSPRPMSPGPMSPGAMAPAPAGQRLSLNTASPAPESHGLGITAPTKRNLTQGQKRERCRNCIIYNEHQRQKYKALVWVAIIVLPLLLLANMSWMGVMVKNIILTVAHLTSQFSLGGPNEAGKALSDATNVAAVEYIMIFCLGLVILSQVMKFIEFCCFKLKI